MPDTGCFGRGSRDAGVQISKDVPMVSLLEFSTTHETPHSWRERRAAFELRQDARHSSDMMGSMM